MARNLGAEMEIIWVKHSDGWVPRKAHLYTERQLKRMFELKEAWTPFNHDDVFGLAKRDEQ